MKFRMFKLAQDDSFQYQLLSEDDKLILTSSPFPDRESCVASIQATIAELRQADNFEIFQIDEKFYFRILDKSGNELNVSEPYESEDSVSQAISFINENTRNREDFEVTFSTTSPEPAIDNLINLRKEVNYDEFYDLDQASPTGTSGFEPFQHPDSQLYYFHFNDDQGVPILYSRSFNTAGKRNKRIEIVIKNGSNPDRYDIIERNGRYHFIIKATNGQEIARSRAFDEAEEAENQATLLQQALPDYKEQYVKAKKARKPKSVNEYNFGQRSTTGLPGFESFRSEENKEYYFHFNDAVGEAILYSEGYSSSRSRTTGIKSVIKNSVYDDRFEVKEEEGMYFFVLRAGNRQEISRSKKFPDRESLEEALNYVKELAPTYAEEYKVKLPVTTTTETFTLNLPEEEQIDDNALGVADIPSEQNISAETKIKKIDQYDLSQPSTSGQSGFETFRSEKDQEYYFHFNDAEGRALLYSEGYQSSQGRAKGIKSVITNSLTEGNIVERQEEEKYYFVVLAKNKQEIARSRYFDQEEEMLTAKNYYQGQAPVYAKDYNVDLALSDYRLLSTSQNTQAGFEPYVNDQDQQYYFLFNDQEAQPLFFSKGFESEEDRDLAIQNLIANSTDPNAYRLHMNGNQYYFTMMDVGGTEIARSRFFPSQTAMDQEISWIQTYISQLAPMQSQASEESEKDPDAEYIAGRYFLNPQSFSQQAGFDLYEDDLDGLYYYYFNDADGKPLFYSRSNDTIPEREADIHFLITQPTAELASHIHQDDKGYFFTIANYDKDELGRSRYFESEDNAHHHLGIFLSQVLNYAEEFGLTKEEDASQDPGVGFLLGGYLLGSQSFSGSQGFDPYFREEDQLYYFQYNDENAQPFYYSRGFTSAEARDQAIRDTIRYSETGQFRLLQDEEGYYSVLLTDEGDELGRTKYCNKSGEASTYMHKLREELPAYKGSYGIEEFKEEVQPVESKEKESAAQEEHASSTALGAAALVAGYALYRAGTTEGPGFEKFQLDDSPLHYFQLNGSDGTGLFYSKGFGTSEERDAQISQVATFADGLGQYSPFQEGDQHYFVLSNDIGKALGRSTFFGSRESMDQAISWMRKNTGALAAAIGLAVVAPSDTPEKVSDSDSPIDPVQENGVERAQAEEKSWLEKNWPWLLLILLLLALIFFNRSCNNDAIPPAAIEDQSSEPQGQNIPLVAADDSTLMDSTASLSDTINRDNTKVDEALENGQHVNGLSDNTSSNGTNSNAETADEKEESEKDTKESGNSNRYRGAESSENEDSNSRLDATALGFSPNSAEGEMANFLSGPITDNDLPSDPFILDQAKFGFDSHVLNKSAYPQLDNLAKLLKSYPNVKIEIRGHRNQSEKQQYVGPIQPDGIALAGIRARCIYRKLEPRGIPSSRMTFKSFDDTNPLVEEDSDANRQTNRRIEIVITER